MQKDTYYPLKTEETDESVLEATNSPPVVTNVTVTVARGKPVPVTSTAHAVIETSVQQTRCLFKSCCCGCSLATGVFIIAVLDLLASLSILGMAAMVYYAKANEATIDNYITENSEKYGHEDPGSMNSRPGQDGHGQLPGQPQGADGEMPSEMSAEEMVEKTNSIIDISAEFAPVYILFAAITMYFACKGIHAARKADANAAKIYYKWRISMLVFSAFMTMMGGCGMIQIALVIYFTLIVRSYVKSLEVPVVVVEQVPQAQV